MLYLEVVEIQYVTQLCNFLFVAKKREIYDKYGKEGLINGGGGT